MPRIAILPDTLASQVAAGEVVERPSAVLKELIENALDAGASKIEVHALKGGVAQLKVSDDGHGMDKENALLCLERHATSKLSSSEELTAIKTHGFRGEALPSIASVSRFSLLTNDDLSTPACAISVEGGKILEVREDSRARGTTIEVKDLFFNVPARRKFLKTEGTEYGHLEHAVRLSALGNCSVRYTFTHNRRPVWDLLPTQDRRARISELIGSQDAGELIEVPPYQFQNITVSGYLLPGRLARGSGRSQTVFINQRPVDDPVIRGAIRDGYQGFIQPGQYPVVWLWIDMPLNELDVNVHPAKKEVRFSRPSEIKHALSESIASALSPRPRPALSPPQFMASSGNISPAQSPAPSAPHSEHEQASSFRLKEQWSTPDQKEFSLPLSSPETPSAESVSSPSPFTFIGYFKQSYWLLEDENGLVLLDYEAAQNRILYEALKESYHKQALNSQALLIPLIIELTGHDQNILEKNLETFQELGMDVSSFGGKSYQILSLPALLEITDMQDAQAFFLSLIDSLSSSADFNTQRAKEKALERLFCSLAEEGAKHTHRKHVHYQEKFLETLMNCDLPYCTPSGKPTMIHFSENDLKKKFS